MNDSRGWWRGAAARFRAPIRVARWSGAAVFMVHLAASKASADWPSSSATNVAVCTAVNSQVLPAVAPDLTGGLYVAWEDQRSGSPKDIYAMHILSSGTTDPAWPVNGKVICGAAGNQTTTGMVSDGTGGVVLAWVDARSGSNDVHAHHIKSDGSLDSNWPVNGLAICTASGGQTSVGNGSDESGGALLAWRDTRNDTDLYAAHVLANGVVDPLWPVNGVALASGSGAQTNATFASDG